MKLSSDVRSHWMRDKLEATLTPTHLSIVDQGWQHVGHAEEGAGHFKVTIASPQFTQKGEKLPLVQCHQLVYKALGDALSSTIHAIQIDIQY